LIGENERDEKAFTHASNKLDMAAYAVVVGLDIK
jgi:hypothetical protein